MQSYSGGKNGPNLKVTFQYEDKTNQFLWAYIINKQKRKTKKTPLPMNRNSMIFGGAGLILNWMHIPSNLSIEYLSPNNFQ